MTNIITTVGTSIFTNAMQAKNCKEKNIREDIRNYYENLEDNEPNSEYENELETLIWNHVQTKGDEVCAEVKSIIKIANGKPAKVRLLATDTILSQLAAKIIERWFDKRYTKLSITPKPHIDISFDVSNDVIKGLWVRKGQDFVNDGFDNLFDKLKAYKKGDIVNITGGYKAIIPMVSILGQLKGFDLQYIYEDSEALITFGGLPVHFDTSIAELYAIYLDSTILYDSNFIIEYKESVIKKFDDWKLIRYDFKKSKYIITEFGKFFNEYISINYEGGKNILGHLIEYKIYEHYQIKKNGKFKDYQIIDRGKAIKFNGEEADIDIYFESTLNPSVVAFGECKSFSLTRDSGKILKDLKRRHIISKGLKLQLDDYILFVYKVDFQDKNWLNDTYIKCKEYACNNGFTFGIQIINIQRNQENLEYQKFINEKILKLEPYV